MAIGWSRDGKDNARRVRQVAPSCQSVVVVNRVAGFIAFNTRRAAPKGRGRPGRIILSPRPLNFKGFSPDSCCNNRSGSLTQVGWVTGWVTRSNCLFRPYRLHFIPAGRVGNPCARKHTKGFSPFLFEERAFDPSFAACFCIRRGWRK